MKYRYIDDFTLIPNNIYDLNLSLTTFFVYCYIVSKPENWTFNNKEIMKKLGIGSKTTMSKSIKELVEKGLIKREQNRAKNGKLLGTYSYQFCDIKNVLFLTQKRQKINKFKQFYRKPVFWKKNFCVPLFADSSPKYTSTEVQNMDFGENRVLTPLLVKKEIKKKSFRDFAEKKCLENSDEFSLDSDTRNRVLENNDLISHEGEVEKDILAVDQSRPNLKKVAKEIYDLYPSRCPNNFSQNPLGRKISKTSKDKEKILKLIKTRGESTIRKIFIGYIAQSKQEGVFFPNLSTFLNNLPEIDEFLNAEQDAEVFDPEKVLEKQDIYAMIEVLEPKEKIFVIECSPKGKVSGAEEKLLTPQMLLRKLKNEGQHHKFVRRFNP